MNWIAMNDGRPGEQQSAEERAEILRNNPSARANNEYYIQVKRVLREFECYDWRVFRDCGGHLAYAALEVLKASYGLTPLQADAARPGTAEQLALPAAQLKHGS